MQTGERRELVFKEDGQEYAQVTRMLGNGRLEAYCFDSVKRLCHIRGKIKNRVWINNGDIILVSLREFQDEKCDVIMKYFDYEAKELKELGELPDNVKINEGDFDFGEEGDYAGGSGSDEDEEEKDDLDIDNI